MNLSPNEIRNYEFATQMRGYSKEDVENLREQAAAALESLKQENMKLSMEIDSLKTQLAGLREFEDTIKSAAIDARRNADLTVANAKKEAELIVSRAKTEVMEIIGSRAQKVGEIEDQITKLQLAKKSYLSKLRNLIKSHLDILEEIVSGEAATEGKSILEVTESTEVTRKKLETVATEPDKLESIKTEEANAAEQIVPAPALPEGESVPTTTEDVSTDRTPQLDRPVDPELAAALEEYQHMEEFPEEQQPTTAPVTDHIPAPGELVETSARAEDIPKGFIAPEIDTMVGDTTDKVNIAADDQQDTMEHNDIDMDTLHDSDEDDSEIAPENLAKELDRVVTKFEEVMDKAERS